jgi:ribonuclease E
VRSTESTALRVLRGLEEEGEKNRAAAVTVKIASEVTLYILNQKRRELSRIENEHGMQISFEPKEDLAAGTFELERTKSRDPGERPRPSAVGIEAGFVASDEPEPDYPEEADAEEIETAEEETGDREEAGEVQSFDRSEGAREGREGGRRRRRRGGRGRNRDRGERPEQPQQASAPVAETGEAAEENEGEDFAAAPEGEQNGHAPAALGENGETRRRRRRRRGRRGGRERAEQGERPQGAGMEHHQTGFVSEADRFGALPDEIDTTPSDAKHAPGAPSAPVWSLQDDIPDTTPQDESSAVDDKPKKKGWWQRTFSSE